MVKERSQVNASPIVYVVDDDAGIRESLDTLLRSVGLRVRGFSGTAEFLATPRENVDSCLLLDVRLRGESGLVFQQRVDERPDIPIVFISGFADVASCKRAMKAGAIDFLVKPFADQELIDAVDFALKADAKRRAAARTLEHLNDAYDSLTRRERQVFAYVADGAPNKQIAAHLGLSLITVKLHRAAVMRKMKASSLADLVRKQQTLSSSGRFQVSPLSMPERWIG